MNINLFIFTLISLFIFTLGIWFLFSQHQYFNSIDANIIKSSCTSVLDDNNVSYYTCYLLLEYVIKKKRYINNIILIGYNAYSEGNKLLIQYNNKNPLDIQIAQLLKPQIGIILIEVSIFAILILWLLYL